MSAFLRTASAALAGLLLLTACNGSGGASASSSVPSATRATDAAPAASTAGPPNPASATSAAPSSSAAGVSLSGVWKGQYSGRYSGTFHLTWTQAGASLAGTIELSQPSSTLHLTGHLAGTRIAFGTVGTAEITYTGDVSGDQMIGSYAVGGQTVGTWRASHA